MILRGFKKFPFYRQLDIMDCGPTCLKMIAANYGKEYTTEELRVKSYISREGVSLGGIAEAAEKIGFHALPVSATIDNIKKEIPLPCIAHWRQGHFIVVYKINKKKVVVGDPGHGIMKYRIDHFMDGWIGKKSNRENEKGYLLLLEPTPKFYDLEPDGSKKIGLKYLLSYFKPYYKLVLQLFLGLFVGSIIQLIFPFLTQSIVDYGIKFENLSFIYLLLIAQLALFISQTSVEVIRGWILLHITSRVNINLISDYLIKLMKLPISFFDSKKTGDIIQRIYDHNRIQNFLSISSLNTLFSVFNVVIFGSVLAFYSVKIFLFFLVGSLLYISWTLIFLKKRAELDYKRFDQDADNQSSLYQLISGMQEIKLNGSERRRRWEWEEIQAKLFKISIKGLALTQSQNTGGRFIDELKNIIITFISAKAVIDGNLTLGMMLSIQYILGQLNSPIRNFVSFIQSGQDAKISLERLSEIHSIQDEDLTASTNIITSDLDLDNEISLDKVSFRYGGNSSPLVLKDVSLKIPKGKITAIVGTSGSGKTTLIKLLLNFYQPQCGTIKIGKTKFGDIKSSEWRNHCGVVMQDGFIFNDTVLRNITESSPEGKTNKKLLKNAIRIANIEKFIENLALGLETRIGATGINISGGQKQRILIARAVYKNPKIIFFDEATSALDANNERTIMRNLQEFYQGKTVVIVAHRLSTVKNADQIVVLQDGTIIEQGSHEELVNIKGAYYMLVKNQLELGT